MNTLLDIIETTPQSITRKQGGALWLISTLDGLLSLYPHRSEGYTPVTVFIRENGRIDTRVLWAHPAGGYQGSEF